MSFDTIYKGSSIVTHDKTFISDIAVKDGKIVKLGNLSEENANQILDFTREVKNMDEQNKIYYLA